MKTTEFRFYSRAVSLSLFDSVCEPQPTATAEGLFHPHIIHHNPILVQIVVDPLRASRCRNSRRHHVIAASVHVCTVPLTFLQNETGFQLVLPSNVRLQQACAASVWVGEQHRPLRDILKLSFSRIWMVRGTPFTVGTRCCCSCRRRCRCPTAAASSSSSSCLSLSANNPDRPLLCVQELLANMPALFLFRSAKQPRRARIPLLSKCHKPALPAVF